ncbi:MAG: cytochrome c-type biogenesis protein CcmH [Pseudohongiellaceae bacterium]|jgi:cytochrome c-type biogenesis protein CcmH
MRQVLRLSMLWVFFAMLSPAAISQVDTFEFERPEQQQRFRRISDELRCPMCQNTSLSGSSGGVAEDLRREIHRMIIEGMTDQEIEQFMFERYGDFIFYKPRLTPETLFLWFGPILFLLIGAIAAFLVWRRARTSSGSSVSLNLDETERLNKLLNKS